MPRSPTTRRNRYRLFPHPSSHLQYQPPAPHSAGFHQHTPGIPAVIIVIIQILIGIGINRLQFEQFSTCCISNDFSYTFCITGSWKNTTSFFPWMPSLSVFALSLVPVLSSVVAALDSFSNAVPALDYVRLSSCPFPAPTSSQHTHYQNTRCH